jgi:membrane-associated phospholipid phosphatase
MILRFVIILLVIISGNSLYSSDPHYLRIGTKAEVNNLIAGERDLFKRADYSHPSSFLLKDTIAGYGEENSLLNKTSKGKKWLNAAYIPAGLITAGLITMAVPENTLLSKYTIRQKITDKYPGFSTNADNYLQFAPGVAVFGLKAIGLKSRSDLLNQSIILAKSEFLTLAIVESLKSVTHIERPNGNGYQAMPSGHTAQAFQLATMLDMEYRDVSPWISVSGYAVASVTGALRMLNNKHWISDVLVGAGTGIFTTKFVYLTHQYHWGKNNNVVILPAIYKDGGGVVFAMQL